MSERPSQNLDGLDPELARQIDAVCRRFEAGWREGRQPLIKDFLGDVPDEGQPALRAELEALERELREQGKGDRIVGAVLLGGFAAFCAAAVAWAMEVRPVGLVVAGLAGALAGVAVASCKPFWAAGLRASQAFRQATEEYDGPARHGEAIQRALAGQKDMLAWRVAVWAISGALIGAMLGGMFSKGLGQPLASLAGAVLGVAARTGLGLLVWLVSTASTVLIVRKAGLTLGGAIIGGLCGAIFGMELWRRWWHVSPPNLGALALGIPMALLFALAGRERSRLKLERTRNGK